MLHKLVRLSGQVNAEFVQILNNTGWLFAGKVLRMLISLMVGTWIARYLRPEGFGQLQYALVFVSFFDPLSTIKMGPIITRDLVQRPQESQLILGTAFTLQLVGGILAIGLCFFFLLLSSVQPLVHLLIAITALKFIFNSFQPIENWFESRVASKYVVFAEHCGFLLIVLLKSGLVLWQATVVAFAIATVLESFLYALGLIFFYLKQHQSIWTWHTNWSSIQYLLQESWPLVLSSTAAVIYLNIDQIMLGNLLDKHAVGIYASAATLSEATAFLPVIIGSSLYPRIIKSRQLESIIYQQRLQQYYDLNSGISYGLTLLLIPISGLIITHLYGAEYISAIPIFKIHILSSLFTYLSIAQSKWIITEGLQKYNFYARLTGLITNITLNLFFIPLYGGVGAAIATLISYAIGGYFFFWLLPATRSNAYLMTKAMLLPFRLLFSCTWLLKHPKQ